MAVTAGFPFGWIPGPVTPAFLPAVTSTSILADIITAYLLLRQFMAGRSPSLAVLGAGYLAVATSAFVYLWTFPSVIGPGFLGAGKQTAIWMWSLWHAGFPAVVLAYILAWEKGQRIDLTPQRVAKAVWILPLTVVAGVAVLGFFAIKFHAALPVLILDETHYSQLFVYGICGTACALCAIDIALLLKPARAQYVANSWIAIAVLALLVDLIFTLSGGRYSVGWYLARSSGAISASIVMLALLYEAGRLTMVVAHAERRLSAVVDGVADALLTVDRDNRIASANPAAAEVFGYAVERFQGLEAGKVITDFGKVARAAPFSGTIQAEGRRANGGRFPIELSVSEISVDGAPATIAIARDITQRHAAQAAIADARDRALDAAEVKANFLATMSHEIRTPINAVIGMTELLLDTELDDEQRDYAGTVRASADVLLAVINDILDFSKLEAGKMELDALDFALPATVESVRNIMASQARHKGLALEAVVDPALPRMVRGDPNRLLQILLNLVGNAVKFTPRGRILVRADLEREREDGCSVRFSVTDTGIGLSELERERLFEPFVQGDGSTSRRFGGTGLGLSISKRLVEMMGGLIGVVSEEGAGSTFWFTARLQRAIAPNGRPDARNVAALKPATSARPGRILLAEDNAVNQHIISVQLEKLGHAVRAVTNGRAAIAAVFEEQFDAVLMDVQMPDIDGFEATRTIRQREAPSGKHVPIIAMTANALEGDRAACLAAGMDDYLAKPARLAELSRMLNAWLAPAAPSRTPAEAT